ncbi:MAG: hypothetical protein Crog4KO_19910 [Crocinitomicaceae bacterium]
MRVIALFISTLFFTGVLHAQKKNIPKETGGLIGYYFWEEDSIGNIVGGDIRKPFVQNYLVRFQTSSGRVLSDSLKERALQKRIEKLVHEKSRVDETSIQYKEKRRQKIPLKRIQADKPASVLYVKSNNMWSSRIRKNVVYFNVENDQYRFSHSLDSLILYTSNVRLKSRGQYMVICHNETNSDGSKAIVREEVYNYQGEEISAELNGAVPQPKRVLLFANGYRGSNKDRDETDNLVTNYDRYRYWYKLDDSIQQRLQPDYTYYIDGSMGVNTSSHRSKIAFGWSYLMARAFPNSKKSKLILNTKENPVGFQERKNQGKIAGRTYLEMHCKTPVYEHVKDTFDIVCHSMGYAYVLGFIEEIQDQIELGKCYILAPEGACVAGMDWSLFEEVWQYGKQDGKATIENQDVIAPQCAVLGLDQLPEEKGGRVYMPEDAPQAKDIVKSHDTRYFDWIIKSIQVGEKGYVH